MYEINLYEELTILDASFNPSKEYKLDPGTYKLICIPNPRGWGAEWLIVYGLGIKGMAISAWLNNPSVSFTGITPHFDEGGEEI
ncbi:MAG TPA: hypothetical protein VEA59_05660 [Patescibacteria group bacterium]|nr:hypothetical protein [Patescibacteria group bacterium]